MRKVRLWICYKCKIVYNRKKKDTYCRCSCGQKMTAARKWPDEKFWEQKERTNARKRKRKSTEFKRHSKILDSHGYVLRSTAKARKLWCKIERTPYLSTLKTQGEKLIAEIHTNMIHAKGVNGMVSPPALEIVKTKSMTSFGRYERGIAIRKYAITVFQHRPMNLTSMKATLLHELLHHIDAEAKHKDQKTFDSRYHDRTWSNRLKKLKTLLHVANEEILTAD